MSDLVPYQANPETRGTVPVQFFEAGAGAAAAGMQPTPRPANRPRELPPAVPSAASFQPFEYDGSAPTQPIPAPPRSASQKGSGE